MSATTRRDRAIGTLVGLALGDALGAPYEFRQPSPVNALAFGRGVFGTAPGAPTDDTDLAYRCALAVADYGPTEKACEDYGKRLAEWACNNPPDIGNQTAKAARVLKEGRRLSPDPQAQGNGSLMAVAALGVADAEPRIVKEFTNLTHPSARAIVTNYRFVQNIARGIESGNPHMLRAMPMPPNVRVAGPMMGWCRLSAGVAGAAIERTAQGQDPFDALVEAISLGGDTDTNGAITGALLGSVYGTRWIPERLRTQLVMADSMATLGAQIYEQRAQ